MRLPSILSTVPICTPSAPITSICSLISLIADLQEGRPLLATLGWACGASERNSSHVPNSRGSGGFPTTWGSIGRQALRLRGDRDRAKRHVQRVDKSAWPVGELHLTGQLLAKRLHHSGAEASPGGRLDRRTSSFRPNKAKPLLQLVHRPCDFHAARGDG